MANLQTFLLVKDFIESGIAIIRVHPGGYGGYPGCQIA